MLCFLRHVQRLELSVAGCTQLHTTTYLYNFTIVAYLFPLVFSSPLMLTNRRRLCFSSVFFTCTCISCFFVTFLPPVVWAENLAGGCHRFDATSVMSVEAYRPYLGHTFLSFPSLPSLFQSLHFPPLPFFSFPFFCSFLFVPFPIFPFPSPYPILVFLFPLPRPVFSLPFSSFLLYSIPSPYSPPLPFSSLPFPIFPSVRFPITALSSPSSLPFLLSPFPILFFRILFHLSTSVYFPFLPSSPIFL